VYGEQMGMDVKGVEMSGDGTEIPSRADLCLSCVG